MKSHLLPSVALGTSEETGANRVTQAVDIGRLRAAVRPGGVNPGRSLASAHRRKERPDCRFGWW